MTDRWAIIKYKGDHYPVLIHINPPERFMRAGGYEILKELDGPDVRAHMLDMYKNFFTLLPLEDDALYQTTGYLAPNGEFYPVEFAYHHFFATALSAKYYGELGNTGTLEERGWVRVSWDGFLLCGRNHRLTYSQVETICKLQAVGNWKDNLGKCVRSNAEAHALVE